MSFLRRLRRGLQKKYPIESPQTVDVSTNSPAQLSPQIRPMVLEPRIMLDAAAMVSITDPIDAAHAAHPATDIDIHEHTTQDNSPESTQLLDALAKTAPTPDLIAPHEQTEKHEIAFIDSDITDLQTIIDGIDSDVEVVVIDNSQDGFKQMAEILADRHDLGAIHIFSHGTHGEISLGKGSLDSTTLQNYTESLTTIGESLSSEGDILLYGCDVGTGIKGSEFITALAQATNADVAASNDDTGATALGGDWDLEVSTGVIEAASLNITGYSHILQTNLIANGDFASGTANWTTDYTLNTSSITDPGEYMVVADPVDAHTSWPSGTYDHTNGDNTGKFLAVNAGTDANVDIWKGENITIDKGGVYRFGYWISTLAAVDSSTSTSPQFDIDYTTDSGTNWYTHSQSDIISDGYTPGRWQYQYFDIAIDAPKTIQFRIQTVNIDGGGNDFGLDDISFTLKDVTTFTEQTAVNVNSDFVVNGNPADLPSDNILAVNISSNSTANDSLSLLTSNPGSSGIWLDTTNSNALMAGSTIIGLADAAGVSGNTTWKFTFNESATRENVQNTGRAILFNNSSDTPNTTERVITFNTEGKSTNKELAVETVNDAPKFGANQTLTSVNEDTSSPSGATISSLFDSTFSDAESDDFDGIAITTNDANSTTQGAWQYTTDGGTNWYDIGSQTTSAALMLKDTTDSKIRFVPVADFNGTPGSLTVHAVSMDKGLEATKYEGYFDTNVDFFATATEINHTGKNYDNVTNQINYPDTATEEETFSVKWQGYFKASTLGSYTFQLSTDDSSYLWLGSAGDPLSNLLTSRTTSNALLHANVNTVSITTTLMAGELYPLLMYYGENAIGEAAILSFTVPSGSAQTDGAGFYYQTSAQTSWTSGDTTVTFDTTADDATSHVSAAGKTLSTSITAVNDAPTLADLTAVTFTENAVNSTAAILDSAITFADIDALDFDTGVFTLTGINANETVSIENQTVDTSGNIQRSSNDIQVSDGTNWTTIGTVDTTKTGINTDLSITFNTSAIATNIDAMLQRLNYLNTSNTGQTAHDLTMNITDGDGANTGDKTISVTVTAENDAPTAADKTVTMNENSTYTFDSTDFNFSDVDGDTLSKIQVTSLETAGTLEYYSYDSDVGYIWKDVTVDLTLKKGDTSSFPLRFTPATGANGDTYATFDFKVNDNALYSTSSYTMTMKVTVVNDTPVVTAGGILVYTEGDSAAILDGSISITDSDDTQIDGATVTISSGRTTGDLLAVATQNGISGAYDSSTGVLTLTGTATKADYETALESVKYSSSSADLTSTSASRTITWAVTDANSDNLGAKTSSGVTSTISITAINDTPVLSSSGTLAYTEGGTAAVIDSNITITDADDSNMASATVTISSGFTSGDTLAVATQNGISGTYDSSTGILTMTGSASKANYETALKSVKYSSASNNPTATSSSRTITWAVTDANSDSIGAETSAGDTSSIAITAVNNIPTLTSFSDSVESADLNTQVEISLTELKVQGNEADSDGTVDAFIIKAVSSGTLTIGNAANTATAFNATTNNTVDSTNKAYWTPASGKSGTLNAFTAVAVDNDGAESTDAVQATITVGPNDNPTMTGVPSAINVVMDKSSDVDLSAVTLSDSDSFGNDFSLKITAASGTLSASPGSGVSVLNSGTAIITLTGKFSDIDTYLNTASNIKYLSANNSSTATSLTLSINDHDGSGDISAGTVDVDIAVKYDPTLSNLPTAVSAIMDVKSDVDLSAATLFDKDTTGSTFTLKIAAGAGTLYASDGGSVTVSNSGNGTITLTGTYGNIDTYLNTKSNIRFLSDSGVSTATTLTLTMNDDDGSGDISAGSVKMNILANKLSNWDFESGNTGFTSSYYYRTNWSGYNRELVYEKRYSIVSDANNVHPSWPSGTEDHTKADGTGLFFIANGGPKTTDVVWQSSSTISVTDVDNAYRFQAYLTTVFPVTETNGIDNGPSLVFEIGDGGSNWTALGTTVDFSATSVVGKWEMTFKDGEFNTTGDYYIRLRNNKTVAGGNDFGIDDIFFGFAPEGTSTKSFAVSGGDETAPTITPDTTHTTFIEQTPTIVDDAITISDPQGNADWNGGRLQVSIRENATSNDRLTIASSNPGGSGIWIDTSNNTVNSGTTEIGTVSVANNGTLNDSGGYASVSGSDKLIFAFTANATDALVQDTARAIGFANDSDAPSSTSRRVSFAAYDNAGHGRSGQQYIDITQVNDLPTASAKTISTNEDTSYYFSDSDFNFTDVDTADLLNKIQITSLESTGTLEYNNNGTWQDVTTDQVITKVDIDADLLRFSPAAGESGNSYDSFSFKVNDGTAYSSAAYTMTVDVTAANDLPTSANKTITTNEDSAYTFTAADFNFSDSDTDDTLDSVKITSLESVGTLEYNDGSSWGNVTTDQVVTKADIDANNLRFTPVADANGIGYDSFAFKVNDGTTFSTAAYTMSVNVTPVNDLPSFTIGADQSINEGSVAQVVTGWATNLSNGPTDESSQVLTFNTSNNNNSLFSVQPYVDSAGALRYTTGTDKVGSATVTIYLKDDGGTTNSGVDQSASQTFTITVVDVNDAPSFTLGSSITKAEDAGAQTINGWATNLYEGAASESSQNLTFTLTNTNNNLFSTQPTVDASGNLTFTSDTNANGMASVFVTLADDGGTTHGGSDHSASKQFTITITSVNDETTMIANKGLSILEDAGQTTITSSMLQVSDVDVSNTTQLIYTLGTVSSKGVLKNNGTTLAANDTFTQADIDANNISYTPTSDANGSDSFTFSAKDSNDSSTTPDSTFSISIASVNDAPVFTMGANQSINEDAGAITVNNWATSISKGAADESAQTLAFVVSNDNNDLFSVQPAIDANGNLVYTPAANKYGSATITVYLSDDGGTLNSGENSSVSQTFTITVNEINDIPTLTGFAKVIGSVNEDSQLEVTLSSLKSQGDEADIDGTVEAFVVKAVSTGTLKIGTDTANATAWATGSNDTVDGTKNIYWTPDANDNGTINAFTVVAQDNDSGESSTAIQAKVTVNELNDAPTLTSFADVVTSTNEDTEAEITLAQLTAQGDQADVDGTVDTFVIKVVSTGTLRLGSDAASATNWALGSNDTINSSTKAYWTPATNENGTLNAFTAVALDNDGAESSTARQVQLTVNAVNDAPTLTSFSSTVDTVNEEGEVAITLTELKAQGNEADIDGTVDGFKIKEVSSGTLKIGADSATAFIWSAGSNDIVDSTNLAYWTPDDNDSGTVKAFTAVAVDNNSGESTTATQVTVAVTAINDAPTFTSDDNLRAINEDTSNPNGEKIADVIAEKFSDNDNFEQLEGIAITANNANSGSEGVWQYSTDTGTNWYNVGSVDTTSALLLTADTKIRFVAVANYNGTPTALTVFAVDDSSAGPSTYTSGNTRETFNTTTDGATSAVSASWVNMGISITAVNDAPTFTDGASLTAVYEDMTTPAGETVSSLMTAKFSDVDSDSLEGIVVTANSANAETEGAWQYSTDNSNWYAI